VAIVVAVEVVVIVAIVVVVVTVVAMEEGDAILGLEVVGVDEMGGIDDMTTLRRLDRANTMTLAVDLAATLGSQRSNIRMIVRTPIGTARIGIRVRMRITVVFRTIYCGRR
jgi:hypothetical protein